MLFCYVHPFLPLGMRGAWCEGTEYFRGIQDSIQERDKVTVKSYGVIRVSILQIRVLWPSYGLLSRSSSQQSVSVLRLCSSLSQALAAPSLYIYNPGLAVATSVSNPTHVF